MFATRHVEPVDSDSKKLLVNSKLNSIVANIVTSKALVTTSVALVTSKALAF